MITCELCFHHCALEEGQTGLCLARGNRGEKITCLNYGQVTSLGLDSIEKKPLARFYPGSKILSVGSFGCNLKCPFCQNHEIAAAGETCAQIAYISPETLSAKAAELKNRGNLGVAYTYNEPLVGWEFVRDCGALVREKGMKNVLVTNGTAEESVLRELLPLIDGVNIDLKGFTQEYYDWLCGDLESVKRAIILSAEHCHTEITTLIVPGRNDSMEEMEALSSWLAGINPEIPLHVTRYFPRYRMAEGEPTSVETVRRLAAVASVRLRYVYTGNL